MGTLDKLEKRFGWLAIPNLSMLIVVGQVAVYFLVATSRPEVLNQLAFSPALVREGEVWRLLTFIFIPPGMHPLWTFFAWYIFYLMGSALEGYWGEFRYTLYLLIAYAATVAAAFLSADYVFGAEFSNAFIAGSVFLAFAHLNPEFELLLFFILPVKIKWLAALTWLGYGYSILVGNWVTCALVLASVSNYLLFFGRDIFLVIRRGHWRMEHGFQEFAKKNRPIHQCRACGKTDKSDPQMDFRYCTKCSGHVCFCMDHIRDHEHIS